MSGGSWDYFCYKLDEVGRRLTYERDPLRVALGRKLLTYVDAMHDIEWVDSGDMGEGDDQEALRKVVSKVVSKGDELAAVSVEVDVLIARLEAARGRQ